MAIRDNLVKEESYIGYRFEDAIDLRTYVTTGVSGKATPFEVPEDGIIILKMIRGNYDDNPQMLLNIKDNNESKEFRFETNADMDTREFEVYAGQKVEIRERWQGNSESVYFYPYRKTGNNTSYNASVEIKSVVSDWAQNDPEDPSYIENRPFYEETTVNVLYPDEDRTFYPFQGVYCIELEMQTDLSFDNTILIRYDNVYFKLKPIEYNGYLAAGDIDFLETFENKKDPFVLLYDFNTKILQFGALGRFLEEGTAEEGTTKTINFGISEIERYVEQIPEEFIPDSVKIPAATGEDNGKFLMVSNGVATWVSLTNVSEVGA